MRLRSLLAAVPLVSLIAFGGSCEQKQVDPQPVPSASANAGSSSVASTAASVTAPARAVASAGAVGSTSPDGGSPSPAFREAACPRNMVLVEGNFCPAAIQTCLEHHPEYLKDKNVSERCLRYEKPSKCLSKVKKPMRFCVDTYEWPNERGEKPLVLVQWIEAKKHCESVGKRLCDEEEWLFACEGEEMLPHVYGFDRDATKCLIDRPYRKRDFGFMRYDNCMANEECRTHFEKIDQRQGAGAFSECVSPFGAYDMNGNANEWVNLPGKEYPNRSGLKGGWWGPVRCRCRPTTTFHPEDDWGYEAGFRCCKSADADSAPTGVSGSAAPAASITPPSRL